MVAERFFFYTSRTAEVIPVLQEFFIKYTFHPSYLLITSSGLGTSLSSHRCDYLGLDSLVLQRLTTLVCRLKTTLRGANELHTILAESTTVYRAVPALLG